MVQNLNQLVHSVTYTIQQQDKEAFFENTRMYVPNLPPNRELPRGAAWESPDVLDEAYGDGRT